MGVNFNVVQKIFLIYSFREGILQTPKNIKNGTACFSLCNKKLKATKLIFVMDH